MKKCIAFLLMMVFSLTTFSYALFVPIETQEVAAIAAVIRPATPKMKYIPIIPPPPIKETLPVEAKFSVSDDEIALIALLTMAEAGCECEEGQRLVIDTVLNRVDDPHFPDNIYDVVYQRNQYAGIQSPYIDRCWVKDELVQLVREEIENRTNYDVIFFRTRRYSDYGVPMFQIEHHYFSSYD